MFTSQSTKPQVFDREDLELLERARHWRPELTLSSCSVPNLREISTTDGLDFATALLYDRILRASANAEFFERVTAERVGADPHKVDLVAIVPGAFYKQHRNTGADGKRVEEIARKLGLKSERIPVKSFGPLEENAQTIAEWLKSRRSQRILLVSLSKGSSDVKRALARPDSGDCFKNVGAWISFSGMVQGTALVDWLRSQPLRYLGVRLLLRLQGHRPSTLEELRWGEGAPLSDWPALPSGLRVVHVHGFPTARHLRHPWAPRGYERLRPLGPNDGGGILLGDLSQLPGIIYPVWGADHYLCPDWDVVPLLERIMLAA